LISRFNYISDNFVCVRGTFTAVAASVIKLPSRFALQTLLILCQV